LLPESTEDLPELPDVPASVTARQIRIWVVRNIPGGLSAIESALAAIPDQQARQEAQVEWEFAPYCERRHPMLESIAFSLGLSQEQVDQAFREASTI
jgi:hypothetical protein